MGVFLFHPVLTFPGVFRTMSSIPANFDELDTAPAGLVNFPIRDLDRFFNEVERVINMNFVGRNGNVNLSWTSLQIGYMKCIVNIIQFGR